MSLPNKPQRGPLLCYVTDLRAIPSRESAGARRALLEKIGAAAAAGVDWIQIREKHLSAKECSALTREALQRVAQATAARPDVVRNSAGEEKPRVLVNDRLDIALATRADGVHLAENSLPPAEAKRLVRTLGRKDNFLVGLSCHSLASARAAAEAGADYIFFGPVFATPSKAAYGAPQGLERLAEVCRAVAIPVLAIGGVTLENAAACLSAGAAGIAAIRLFQDATDLSALVSTLRKISH